MVLVLELGELAAIVGACRWRLVEVTASFAGIQHHFATKVQDVYPTPMSLQYYWSLSYFAEARYIGEYSFGRLDLAPPTSWVRLPCQRHALASR